MIWPVWARSVGAVIDHGAVARVACARCRSVFDVDLVAIAAKRGSYFRLIDARPTCKVSSCRGLGYFVVARSMTSPFVTLASAGGDPCGLDGKRPIDIEPPEPTPTVAFAREKAA